MCSAIPLVIKTVICSIFFKDSVVSVKNVSYEFILEKLLLYTFSNSVIFCIDPILAIKDLILSCILYILSRFIFFVSISENNDEKIKTRYNDLVEANMFVKNLENVQGDERDIMILSTTFGKTSEGRFIQNFGPVNNQTKGYRLLNVLVTRAKYKFIVLTSIPEENIQGWEKEIQSQGNNGKAVFYAYLAYAKAVSENNSETEARILNVLSKNKFTQNDSNAVYSSSNNSNIMRILKEKKLVSETDEVIKNYKIGGFNLDYAIRKQGEEKPKVVIDININDSFSQENVSYKAIIYRRNMFKNMGYEYHLLNATEYI